MPTSQVIIDFLTESNETQKKHILNAYHVLVTRARKGLVIYIPRTYYYKDMYGVNDFINSTYEHLKYCGKKDIDEPNIAFTKIINVVWLLF